jgi:hypothetical protein
VQFVATFQSLPGPQITASRTYTNADDPADARTNLATGGAGTAAVQLIAPGTMYDKRLHQLDLRVSKFLQARRASPGAGQRRRL